MLQVRAHLYQKRFHSHRVFLHCHHRQQDFSSLLDHLPWNFNPNHRLTESKKWRCRQAETRKSCSSNSTYFVVIFFAVYLSFTIMILPGRQRECRTLDSPRVGFNNLEWYSDKTDYKIYICCVKNHLHDKNSIHYVGDMHQSCPTNTRHIKHGHQESNKSLGHVGHTQSEPVKASEKNLTVSINMASMMQNRKSNKRYYFITVIRHEWSTTASNRIRSQTITCQHLHLFSIYQPCALNVMNYI